MNLEKLSKDRFYIKYSFKTIIF